MNISYAAVNEFKCVMIGDAMVGKTCLLLKYVLNEFREDYYPTIIADHPVTLQELGKTYVLHLFDTSGQEKYKRYRHRSYQDTDIVLVCFAIDSRASYENVKTKWISEFREYCPKIPFILVGTKSDLRGEDFSRNRNSTLREQTKKRAEFQAQKESLDEKEEQQNDRDHEQPKNVKPEENTESKTVEKNVEPQSNGIIERNGKDKIENDNGREEIEGKPENNEGKLENNEGKPENNEGKPENMKENPENKEETSENKAETPENKEDKQGNEEENQESKEGQEKQAKTEQDQLKTSGITVTNSEIPEADMKESKQDPEDAKQEDKPEKLNSSERSNEDQTTRTTEQVKKERRETESEKDDVQSNGNQTENLIPRLEGESLAKELSAAMYIECSALKKENIIEVFQKAFDVAFKHFKIEVDKSHGGLKCCNQNCTVI